MKRRDECLGDLTILPFTLFCELDALRDEKLNTGELWAKRNKQMSDLLELAVQAYAARWLPVVMQNTLSLDHLADISRQRWRAARRSMLRVINCSCYRSVFALFLFSQTPVPVGISEEEELDGISGLICAQTALQQLQQLRGHLRNCQFDESRVSTRLCTLRSTIDPEVAARYLDLENRAYWVALIWDTTAAVNLNTRSILTTGLKGACSEPAWKLVRGFLVESLPTRSVAWCRQGHQMCDEVAAQIISAAGICRIYVWRTIASIKEALMEAVEEEGVSFAWKAFLDGLEIHRSTIQPLMDIVEGQVSFLSQANRLNWYHAILDYHMGILILADAIEAAGRMDLLAQLAGTQLRAEHEAFNALNFGLESKYCLLGRPGQAAAAKDRAGSSDSVCPTVTVSFLAIDPYPHNVVATVQLLAKFVRRRRSQESLPEQTYSHLLWTLQRALAELPQSSKSVRDVCTDLRLHT